MPTSDIIFMGRPSSVKNDLQSAIRLSADCLNAFYYMEFTKATSNTEVILITTVDFLLQSLPIPTWHICRVIIS